MTIHHQFNNGRRGGDDHAAVERQIAALGDAILPGRRHRDQLLEHASDAAGRSRHKMRISKLVIVLSLVLVLISPALGALTRMQPPPPQTAEQVNAAALRNAESMQMSFDWALVDLFNQFRENKRPQR